MSRLLSLLLLLSIFVPAVAENYPYRNDYLWVTVPDHADWLYETGENATVDVQLLRYGVPAAGFRDLRLSASVDGKTTGHHIKLGFSPDRLRPFAGEPKDFVQYWRKAVAEDKAAFPLQYTVEDVPEYTTDKMTCQLVKLQLNPEGRSMYGYLFIPRGEGKYPAVLCPPGAGVKTIKDPMRHRYYGEGGMIRCEIEIHGCHPKLSEAEFSQQRKEKGKYLEFGMDNPDDYYMKDVYLGCRRFLDLLTSLPAWDGKNLFTQGGSHSPSPQPCSTSVSTDVRPTIPPLAT